MGMTLIDTLHDFFAGPSISFFRRATVAASEAGASRALVCDPFHQAMRENISSIHAPDVLDPLAILSSSWIGYFGCPGS